MSGFSGINQFGSLTVNGQKIKFEDFDRDHNGKISQDEYESVMKDMQLDTVELSTVDRNGDKEVSEDEFALWEQKIAMQDAVNNMAAAISKDFAGKTEYLTNITNALRDYIDDFANNYKGEDISKMAEDFKAALPTKYAELKASVLASDPDTVKSNVLDEIYTQLTTGENLPASTAKRIAKELEVEANKFLKTYNGNNLAADLKTHLNTYMSKSDAEKLNSAAAQFKANSNTFGAMIDNGAELKQLKEYAKDFLTAALDAGVTIKLNGTTIKTTNAITTVLAKFTDGDELKAAIEDVIAGLDTQTLKETIVLDEQTKAIEAENKKFTDIKGSEYAINASLIDYSGIEGYFDGGECMSRSKASTYELTKRLRNQMSSQLEPLKSQMKEQIKEMLAAKGVPFEKVEQIFENVYSQSFDQTFDTEGMVSTKHQTAFHRGWAKTNTKEFVDQFITNFNTNIAAAINQVNASDKDFDVIDMDMSVLGTDENGNKIDTVGNDDILQSYRNGTVLRTRKHGAEYYVKIAEQVIDGLKAQMMAKARNMCKANGVEFDLSKFNAMFNNAKSLAVNAAVSGVNADGTRQGGVAAGTGGAVVGAGTALGAGALTVAGSVGSLTATGLGTTVTVVSSSSATLFGSAAAASAVPVAGWAVAAVGATVATIALFSGHHSESYLDTRALIDGFTQQFSASFSQWVDAEKAEAKNKK